MICSRYDNGKCASAWCYYKSAGDTCLNPKMKPNPTNADKIRGMSDEELAEFLSTAYFDGFNDGMIHRVEPHKYTIDWIRQPAET